MEILGLNSTADLKEMHSNWVEDSLKVDKQLHESKWSQLGVNLLLRKLKMNLEEERYTDK